MSYTVYILNNTEGKLSTGQTNNLQDRLKRHDDGRSRYTRGKGSWELVYEEDYPTRSEAVLREKQLKKWRHELLLKLIN